jgi:hypothetical protein
MKSFEKGNSTGVFWPLILIAGLGIALTWPAIWNGWPELGHDSIYHPLWLEAFSAQFRAGEWYPRWLSDTNAGLGSPTFFYYTPLSYYLSLPWMSLWSPASRAAWHSIGLSSGFALIASGVIAYFWLIRWAGARGALWGSLIYMLAPWHMAIGLYNAGSWSSFVGFVWMPLGLLGAERLIEGRRGAVVLIAAGYSLSVLTHLPTALLFSPVLLAYPILLAPAERRIRVTFQAGCGIMLGLGMAAICLVPALMQRGEASLDAMNQGSFYDYRKFFLGADIHSIMDYKMRVLVMTISMLAAAALAYWLSRRVHKDDANRTRMLFWLGVSAVCLFFMLQPSGFLWRSVGPLAAIQFPVRFNTILTLAVAALWAGAAPTIVGRRSRQAVLLAGAFGLFWLATTEWAASRAFLAWRSDPQGLERLQDSESLKRDEFPFIPRWALSARRHGIEAPLATLPGHGLRLESASQGTAQGSASIVKWEARRVLLRVETPQPARLLIGHFYYPGWQARDMSDQRLLPVSPSAGDGLLTVDVPAGTHDILLQLEARAYERAGIALSAASWLIACVFGIVSFAVAKRSQPTAPGDKSGSARSA